MTKKAKKRKEFLSSILSVVLCLSMLLGSTMAWFTDTTTNTGNRVETGKLNVALLRYDDAGSKYEDISDGTGDIFATENQTDTKAWPLNGVLWEPGKTQVVYLAVENTGKLALNYNVILSVSYGSTETEVALEEVLTYAVVPGINREETDAYSDWNAILSAATAAGANYTGALASGQSAKMGALLAGETEYFALAVHMDEDAGNDYQKQAITIDVKVMAKQRASESDSFGDQYDADAPFTEKTEAVYVNKTFEDATDWFTSMNIWLNSQNEMEVLEEASGNRYLNVVKNYPSDCKFEINLGDGGKENMVLEFDLAAVKPGRTNMRIYDSANNCLEIATPDPSGKIYHDTNNNKVLAEFSGEEWINFAYILNYTAKTFSVYVDGKPAVENQELPLDDFSKFLFQLNTAEGNDIRMDNLKIYEGTEVRELPADEEGEVPVVLDCIMPTYEDAIAKLTGNVAVHVYGNTLFANDTKSELEIPMQMSDDIEGILVPANVVSEGFGLKVEWDAETGKVTVGDNIVMTVGEKTVMVGTESIALDTAPAVTDGNLMLPLYELAEKVLGKKSFWDDHGFLIISDAEVVLTDTELLSVNNYMLYDHPSKEEILEKFEATSQSHPRIMATQETFDRIVDAYKAGGVMKEWGDELIYQAEFYLKQPLPVLNKVGKSGPELLLIPQGIKDRVQCLALAYYLTGNNAYLNRVYAELENTANFSDWHTVHFLNTAEYMTAVAIGYDWLYQFYTEEQREVIEKALYEKGVLNSYAVYYGIGGTDNNGWWAKDTMNWNLVCNGGSLIGASALLGVEEYAEMAADVMSNALKGMDYALASYYPDGVWAEGIGYWGYATEFMIRACATLTATFGEDFNISKSKGFSTTAEMPIHINGNVDKNNYHDSDEGNGLYTSESLFWLANRFDDSGVANVRYEMMEAQDIDATALDMIYCDLSQLGSETTYPLDAYLSGSELVSMRTSWDDPSGTYLSFHGGEAFIAHGHADSGSFVIDMNGERIASDLGAESYEHPDYFQVEGRYWLYRARAEGHNMVVLNPDKTPGINDSFSAVEALVSKDRGAYSVLNLDDAYSENTSSYRRGYKLEDDRRSVVIRDEFTLTKSENTGYWFMQTKADIEIVDNTTAILTLNNKEYLVRFATNLTDFTLKEMDPVSLPTSPVPTSPAVDNVALGYTKLALEFNAPVGDVYIEMKMIPNDDPAKDESLSNLPISKWSAEMIPDGEISTLPKAEMIYSNNDALLLFNSTDRSYTVNVPEGEGVPTITADVADGVTVEVTAAADLGGTTVIKLTDKHTGLYSFYYITFRVIKVEVVQIVDGAVRHSVKNLWASDNPQAANMDVNVLDGNLNTRWSANGSGQWIMLDLGTKQKINAFGLATYNGTSRTLSYSIDVSEDGVTWKNILVGNTQLTNDLEIVKIDEVSARYVRLTGYGTSTGTWNSITEFATLYFEEQD